MRLFCSSFYPEREREKDPTSPSSAAGHWAYRANDVRAIAFAHLEPILCFLVAIQLQIGRHRRQVRTGDGLFYEDRVVNLSLSSPARLPFLFVELGETIWQISSWISFSS